MLSGDRLSPCGWNTIAQSGKEIYMPITPQQFVSMVKCADAFTNLYNQPPTRIDLTHKKLDEAVFAAYGWKSDLSDEEILEKLLALNLERVKL